MVTHGICATADRLAVPAWPPRLALAGHARPVSHLALRGDAAADAGRDRHPVLPALRQALSRCARARAGERSPVVRACVARRDERVAELPAPRKRRALPQKEVRWLVLRRNGAVLLERRPSSGIWGGLWCFPELTGRAPAGAKRLSPIEHGFTHFRLRIRPLLLKSGSEPYLNRALTPISWMTFAQAEAAALPAPVRTLLRRLGEGVRGAARAA